MTLAKDFEDFVKLLNKHAVEYMVVGGYALAFHGKPRHQIGYPPLRIDILNSIDGVDFNDAVKQMNQIHIEMDLPIYYIGLNDFIKNKQTSGRMQDLTDIQEIKKLLGKKISWEKKEVNDYNHFMKTKLSLKIEGETIKIANFYAEQIGRSLSELIENYLETLISESTDQNQLSLKLKKIIGAVKIPGSFDEKKNLYSYFKNKYS